MNDPAFPEYIEHKLSSQWISPKKSKQSNRKLRDKSMDGNNIKIQLSRLEPHPSPSSCDSEMMLTSIKTEKRVPLMELLSREINLHLKIRALSEMAGKKPSQRNKEEKKLREEIIMKTGFTGFMRKKLIKTDRQAIISDAIITKNETTTNGTLLIPIKINKSREIPLRRTKDTDSVRQQLLNHVKTEGLINMPDDDNSVNVNILNDELDKIHVMPKPNVPNAFIKLKTFSSINVDAQNNSIKEISIEKIISKIAEKIKLCPICHCPSILIVDDNDFNRFSLDRQLKHLGFTADQAANGQIAVNKVIKMSSCSCGGYKLIFMDYDMPVMDGVEATKCLMSYRTSSKPAVIVGVSAFSASEDIETCMEAGMQDFSNNNKQ